MQLIAAVDKHWAIGKNGQMLAVIPADQKLFRQETIGKVVVMGRKTLEALPGGRPLESRTNIVLTKDPDFEVKGAVAVHSMEEALSELSKYREEDIFIIGGQTIYEQFLPFCQEAHITFIDYEYNADTYMVNLEQEGWKVTDCSDEQTYFDLCYEFRRYVRP